MINGLIAIGYKDLWDDYDTVDPLSLLKDIPTIGVLDFIVERQNEVLFAFSDIEAHMKRIYEMRCYLDENAIHRLDSFISTHSAISLFSCESNNLMCKLALQQGNAVDRNLQSNDILNIYKAYLYCTQKWTDVASENIDPNDIEGLFLRIDLPIVEFKLHKDFRTQLFKAKEFFKFCEQDHFFNTYLQWFCDDKKITNWQDYIFQWFGFLDASLKHRWIQFDKAQQELMDFFDIYTIELSNCNTLCDSNDQLYLRDHFLFKPKEGLYLLLNHSLMVDKFYQGMKFDFCKSIISRGGTDENGNLIKNVPVFNALLGRKFSEVIMFYELMNKSFKGNYDVVLSGIEMQPYFENGGEPDFYIRKGNCAFVFEYKDLTLGDPIKYSSDTNFIKQEINKRICKGGDRDRKGGGQLLHSIDMIVNKSKLDSIDVYASTVDLFIPIIITTDRAFSAMGVNKIVFSEFVNIAKNYDFSKTQIAPVVILDFETLFMLSKRLHDKVLDLKTIISEYTSLLLTSPNGIDFNMSFYTFAYDNYRLNAIDEAENNYFFEDIFE